MEEVKLLLFADDIILQTEKPQDSTKNLLELINEFSNVAVYKITYQYLSERGIKKTVPFTIV